MHHTIKKVKKKGTNSFNTHLNVLMNVPQEILKTGQVFININETEKK